MHYASSISVTSSRNLIAVGYMEIESRPSKSHFHTVTREIGQFQFLDGCRRIKSPATQSKSPSIGSDTFTINTSS